METMRILNNSLKQINDNWMKHYESHPDHMTKVRFARFSKHVQFFAERFMMNYQLMPYNGTRAPVVMFGMYTQGDYGFYRRHRGKVIVAWCGSDGAMITPERAALLKSRPARHVVSSTFLAADLARYGIPYEVIPHTPAIPNIPNHPNGDMVYHYGTLQNDVYKNSWLPEIADRTGLHIISTTKRTYTKEQLIDVYRNCFIGLRLTDHDGLPTTGVELGLMGRKLVHNGGTPHSISYQSIDDVCQAIMEAYSTRHESNVHISNDWKRYINIGTTWLNI